MDFYYKLNLIGKGAFGKVYLGIQKLTNRLVAIKCLEKKLIQKSINKLKIQKEIEIMQEVGDNKYIIGLLEVFEDQQFVYLILEYASNGDLLKKISNGYVLKEKEIKDIFVDIVIGLEYIHSKNIIHRDIKLDNILIDEYENYKICDFGVSRKIE